MEEADTSGAVNNYENGITQCVCKCSIIVRTQVCTHCAKQPKRNVQSMNIDHYVQNSMC
jgi:hypothetical protein